MNIFNRIENKLNEWLDECRVYVFSGEQKESLAANISAMIRAELFDKNKQLETQSGIIEDFEKKLDERLRLYLNYRSENIELRNQLQEIKSRVRPAMINELIDKFLDDPAYCDGLIYFDLAERISENILS